MRRFELSGEYQFFGKMIKLDSLSKELSILKNFKMTKNIRKFFWHNRRSMSVNIKNYSI